MRKFVSGYNHCPTVTIPDYFRLSLERSRRNASKLIFFEEFFRLPKNNVDELRNSVRKQSTRKESRASKKFILIFFSFTNDAVVRQRCRFKIHSLTRSSVSLGSLSSPHSIHSPGNPRTSFTPAHANLTTSAKQSRPVIRLCNVVLRMTNVRQTRSIYETNRKLVSLTCVKDKFGSEKLIDASQA